MVESVPKQGEPGLEATPRKSRAKTAFDLLLSHRRSVRPEVRGQLMHLKTSERTRRRPNPTQTLPRSRVEGWLHDTQTGMLLGMPRSARCVQRFDDSLNSAIHITFRTFAASFIDAKAKRSVVESCIKLFYSPPWGLQDMRFNRLWF